MNTAVKPCSRICKFVATLQASWTAQQTVEKATASGCCLPTKQGRLFAGGSTWLGPDRLGTGEIFRGAI